MIVIELTAAINSGGTLQTFYVSTEAWATGAADTPANTAFMPTIKNPGSIAVSVFSDGYVAGGTRLDVGEIVLSNANGQYDAWKDYGFDGRPVVIRQGEKGAAYPAGFPAIFTGTVDNIYTDRGELRVRVKDKQLVFERNVLTTYYAGNNVLPNGAEGSADSKGTVKPRAYGAVTNCAPPSVNTSKLTYQVSDGAVLDIPAVYDRGTSLTKGADYANLAALEAAAPAGGTFITCVALGLFRLGGAPAGTVTADVTQGSNAAARTAAQILKALALAAGVSSGDIDAASVTAMDTANSAVVGIWINDERTFTEAMDEVAQSVGAYYGFDPSGKFVMGIWTAPSGTSLVTLAEYYAGKQTERRPLKDIDLPVYAVKLGHTKNNTVQNDLAAGVAAARKVFSALEYRYEVATDANVLTQFLLSSVLEVDTLLTVTADATAEAARLLALHKVKRDAFEVPIPLSLIASAGLKLAACVTLQISRFGLSGGKLMRVQRIHLELARNRAVLTVWG